LLLLPCSTLRLEWCPVGATATTQTAGAVTAHLAMYQVPPWHLECSSAATAASLHSAATAASLHSAAADAMRCAAAVAAVAAAGALIRIRI
jgi:hypothetical protein